MRYSYSFLLIILIACSDDYDEYYPEAQGSHLSIDFGRQLIELDADPCGQFVLSGEEEFRGWTHRHDLAFFETNTACFKIGFRIVDRSRNIPYSAREIENYFEDYIERQGESIFFEFSIETNGVLYSNIWASGEGSNWFDRDTDFLTTNDFNVTIRPTTYVLDPRDCDSNQPILFFEGNVQGYLYNEDYSDFIEVDFMEFQIELPLE